MLANEISAGRRTHGFALEAGSGGMDLSLMLAASVLATPMIVHALAGPGIASVGSAFGASVMGAAFISPNDILSAAGAPKSAVKQGIAAAAGVPGDISTSNLPNRDC